MTLNELKAHAYDALCQIEAWNKNLKELTKAIVEYKEEPVEAAKTKKTEETEEPEEIK